MWNLFGLLRGKCDSGLSGLTQIEVQCPALTWNIGDKSLKVIEGVRGAAWWETAEQVGASKGNLGFQASPAAWLTLGRFLPHALQPCRSRPCPGEAQESHPDPRGLLHGRPHIKVGSLGR